MSCISITKRLVSYTHCFYEILVRLICIRFLPGGCIRGHYRVVVFNLVSFKIKQLQTNQGLRELIVGRAFFGCTYAEANTERARTDSALPRNTRLLILSAFKL